MPCDSAGEVYNSLAAGEASRVIGSRESQTIDFKRAPYALETNRAKVELAKDVAGMANSSGGIIVIGFVTTRDAGNFYEEASEATPVPRGRLNGVTYRQVIRDLVRPAVDVEIDFHEEPTDTSRGFMTIRVRELGDNQRWATVRRLVESDERVIEGASVPIRDGDQTRWLPADELYELIRRGHAVREVVLESSSEIDQRRISAEDSSAAIDALVRHNDWTEVPVLVWQSRARSEVDLVPHLRGPGGIAEKLERIEPLRPMGFNFDMLATPTEFHGGVLSTDGRHALWVREDGLATGAAVVTSDMLAWADSSSSIAVPLINTFTLVEMTLEYFRFVDHEVLGRVPGVQYVHAIESKRLLVDDSPMARLSPGEPRRPGSIFPTQAVLATRDSRYEFPATRDPEVDAYGALVRVYALFGLGAADVPFVQQDRLSTQALLAFAR